MPLSAQMKIISPQSGTAFLLKQGQQLQVIDPQGQQVSDLFCFNQRDTGEVISSGRSFDQNDSIFLSTGMSLYSNRNRPMLTILEDTCGRHDFLYTPCCLKVFQQSFGDKKHHPSCQENLEKSLAPFGIGPDQIQTTFNIFMNVSINAKGALSIHPPLSKPGDHIIFQAQMDLLVGLTACSDEQSNNQVFKPIHYQIRH